MVVWTQMFLYIPWVIIQYFILFIKLFQLWPLGTFLLGPVSHQSDVFLLSVFFEQILTFRLILYILCPYSRISCLSRKFLFPLFKSSVRNQYLDTLLIALGGWGGGVAFNQQESKKTHICILTCGYTHVNISICSHLYLY